VTHRPSNLRALIACAIALTACLAAGPATAGATDFKPLDSAGLQTFKLFDLGVADANDDGHLDLFTTNHKFDSRFLLGDGDGGLSESLVPLGLSPTPAFPGFEDLHRVPDTTAPGLYLYATDRDEPRDPFHIATTGMPASGRLVFGAQDLQVIDSVNATVTTSRLPDGSSALDFDAAPGARIDVTVEHIDLPIAVHVDAPADPSQIRVGPDVVPATAADFSLSLRDRHGYGFADFNGDGSTDLFIATGGLGGEITDPFFTGRQSDELLLGGPSGFADATTASGLVKGVCRGRAAVPADFDGDGNLDLLESCDAAPAQIYAGDGAGHFHQVAAPPTLGETYRAIDLVGDRRPELVIAAAGGVEVWRSVDGAWVLAQRLRTLNGDAPVQHLAEADVDSDGDPDLFAASRGGNTMLLDVRGRLRRRTPKQLHLPERGTFAAAFADYDNDGDPDLDLMPQGLYEARNGRFHRTGQLSYGPLPNGRIGYGTISWPDLDEDGRRDPVSARGRGEFAAQQIVDRRRNRVDGGNWLEVDLTGRRGNRQAIGAKVRVRTKLGSSWGWVGQSDDSRYSSGHYRVYFGLGQADEIRRVDVIWPDGRKQRVEAHRCNRVLRVSYSRR
jgi:hypothetical protein